MSAEDPLGAARREALRPRFVDPGIIIDPAARAAIRAEKDAALTRQYLSGESLYVAMSKAVKELAERAPPEHDVLIQALGVNISDVRFLEPHAFIFTGCDNEGNPCSAVAHYSQVVAYVTFVPKKGPDRVITGFARADVMGGSK